MQLQQCGETRKEGVCLVNPLEVSTHSQKLLSVSHVTLATEDCLLRARTVRTMWRRFKHD